MNKSSHTKKLTWIFTQQVRRRTKVQLCVKDWKLRLLVICSYFNNISAHKKKNRKHLQVNVHLRWSQRCGTHLSSKAHRWTWVSRHQQRVQRVWPRSEMRGGGFKTQAVEGGKKCRTWAKPLRSLINNDLNQEFSSSRSGAQIGPDGDPKFLCVTLRCASSMAPSFIRTVYLPTLNKSICHLAAFYHFE